ncbi:hypothetical protein [Thermococcus waiotapuensis]|uniref:Uncharacterized protein n=1 Tax=Thermococcus waiotapuensis TaxID=90909 RepID=A0AAE4NVQ7_9EURY|nr:hypothetical protein [Thermococcus waiotapuensis]MDV3104455.1 hypothetical protein [Thermococcus waiotapuensis]
MKLGDLINVKSGRILMSGGPKRIAGIFINEWTRRGLKVLAEGLPFVVEGEVFIGNPLENPGFDAYLVLNPLSKSKSEREVLYGWLTENRNRLVLLYETRYVGDSIVRYGIRNFIDYLLAYRRETVDTEVIKLYCLKNGRIVESKEFIRRGSR